MYSIVKLPKLWEWQHKVTIIKEANNLRTLDLTTLFGKLEEHDQELTFLEKHEKKHEKKINKDKGKDSEVERKCIALKASSSKSSTNEQSDCETSDDENSNDEEMGLFVKRKVGHYKPNCPLIKKDKEKAHHNKSSNSRRAYIAWESASDSSSDESLSSSDESAKFFFMDNKKKKKNVSHSKLEYFNELYYSQLQKTFENLHREVVDAFKTLASNKRIVSYLEDKVLETKNNMEALKKSMVDIQKDKNEDEEPSWFGCETCHIWQKKVNTLKYKLDKALQPKITFSIDLSKFKRPLNPSYKKYKYVQKDSNRKITSLHNLSCHYCYNKGHTIAKCKFRRLFVPKKKIWFLNSGCSRHMMGDISLFIEFVPKKKGFVTYGDNKKGVILGKSSVGTPLSTSISDVMLVAGLKHNLLSISKL
ncbi:uncharacterized protein LOC127102934 [Lathyrus oleraceus]|uniref:uncharacterized protein LOC127102934 n=1 Tax=Pisum sativum TaxID=3888 RepID=UPI0021D2582D|nr:uncharacterized protein LOC127102934 [Pisum sativum]